MTKIINPEITHGVSMGLLRRDRIGYFIVTDRERAVRPQAKYGQLAVWSSVFDHDERAKIRQEFIKAGAVLAIEDQTFDHFYFDPLPIQATNEETSR